MVNTGHVEWPGGEKNANDTVGDMVRAIFGEYAMDGHVSVVLRLFSDQRLLAQLPDYLARFGFRSNLETLFAEPRPFDYYHRTGENTPKTGINWLHVPRRITDAYIVATSGATPNFGLRLVYTRSCGLDGGLEFSQSVGLRRNEAGEPVFFRILECARLDAKGQEQELACRIGHRNADPSQQADFCRLVDRMQRLVDRE